MITKSKIDSIGKILSHKDSQYDEKYMESEYIFDEYRKSHLQPLSELTLDMQFKLENSGLNYYIAQRLKRKPQIIRKLRRFSVRLSQLQDIGGCRIIVNDNKEVEFIKNIMLSYSHINSFKILKVTDYRDKGRDDSGYRAVHIIINKGNRSLELQVRSKIQHYWAESIERTSVIYGNHLKEQEGDQSVINYFKILSDIFHEIESGKIPDTRSQVNLENMRKEAENIITNSDINKLMGSYVDESIVKTLIQKEQNSIQGLNNWVLVFDWNNGNFVTWDVVGKSPDDAVKAYIKYENQFTVADKFEVVLIGSSNIATVRQTHSHYFGINSYEGILENLDKSIIGFSIKMDIDVGARHILSVLYRKRYWGAKSIKKDTLKNHHCQSIITFDSSIKTLIDTNLVIVSEPHEQISIDIKMKSEVERYI